MYVILMPRKSWLFSVTVIERLLSFSKKGFSVHGQHFMTES